MEIHDYLTFLDSLRNDLERLTAVEQRKIEAVRAGDLSSLDECMKQEQAAALALRGREQRRDSMLKELGLEKVPLRELPRRCPTSLQAEAARVTEQLLRAYQVLSSAQSAARTLMESHLRQIDTALGSDQEPTQQTGASRPAQTDFRA